MLKAERSRLDDERTSVTHSTKIYSEHGVVGLQVIVGLYSDGRPGEIFAKMGKPGSSAGSLLDQWAIAVSVGLQCGVPLGMLTAKFKHTVFEPRGPTTNSDLPMCTSPLDYLCRWLDLRFERWLDPSDEGLEGQGN